MLTVAHIRTLILPTITRAIGDGWLLVSVKARGTVDALVIILDFIHDEEPVLMELELTALHIGDGLSYGTMFVSLADADEGCVVFSAKVGEFLAVIA